MEEQQAPPPPPPPRSFRRWRRGGGGERGAPQPQPLLARLSLFGSKNAEGKCPEGPLLSKAEFVEKVRQSNQACHEGDFHKAIVLYGEALGVDPQNCILYSNRSAAYMKTQQYNEALDDAIKARLLNPKWPKLSWKRRLGIQLSGMLREDRILWRVGTDVFLNQKQAESYSLREELNLKPQDSS